MSIVERERTIPPVREVTRRDVLRRAADLLEEFGWCQGDYAKDAYGETAMLMGAHAVSFCAAGALGRALAEFKQLHGRSPSGAGHDFLNAIEPDGAVWNDTRGRTKAEVVARLREAAEQADGEVSL